MRKRHTLLLALAVPVALCAQPVNDLCSGITPEALAIGASLTFSGTRAGATSTGDGVAGSALVTTTGVASVWHAFTTTSCSDVTALYCNTALPATTQWSFLTPTCPGDEQISFSYANFGLLCTNGQFGIQWVNLPAGTYYMPVYGVASSGAYEISISAVACTAGPANDDCSSATVLPVNITCVPVAGSVDHGTASSQPLNECNGATGDANDDVWFAFTATAAEHTITVNSSASMDAVIELYTEDCGSAPLACSDATLDGGVEEIEATDLVPGEIYKVRVFHWYTALAITTGFTICVTGDITTGVNEKPMTEVHVLPNPASNRLTITSADEGLARIMDITGRSKWEGYITRTTDIDVSTWPRGTYIVSLEFERQVRTERVVLQ